MGNPFTTTSVSSYNSNPPPDDGSTGANNIVAWSTIKTKLPDPIKTAFDTSETNTNTAFGKVVGGGGFTSTAVNYTVLLADQGKFIKATASGITITTPDATSVGSPFVFAIVNESSGGITIAGNNPGVQQNIDGVASFSLPAGCGVFLNTDATNWFSAGQNFNGNILPPQGRLTLTTATPVLSADVTAATSVFYTPYTGNLCPVYNGTIFTMMTFTEQTLTLQNSSTYAASTLFDIYGFSNSGSFTIGISPAWSVSTAGSGARGTGAATTELQRLNGFPTNKNSITLHNGATAYSVSANQATYLGSIFMDGTNGQVTCHTSYGQSRKWGIWNAYNRVPVFLKAGDSTATWTYNTASIRSSDAAAANKLTILAGLQEEVCDIQFFQAVQITGSTSSVVSNYIGFNSTSAGSGKHGSAYHNGSTVVHYKDMTAKYLSVPAIGIHDISALESGGGAGTTVFIGTEGSMLLSAQWRA